MRTFLRENSLGLFFGGLFLAAVVGQSFAGWHDYNHLQQADGLGGGRWGRRGREPVRAFVERVRTCVR